MSRTAPGTPTLRPLQPTATSAASKRTRGLRDTRIPGRPGHLWVFQRKHAIFFAMSKGAANQKRSEVLQGTLDLMILKTLQALGPLHGFGIARRLEQVSEEVLQLNEGTVYTSLLRL